MTYQGAVRRQTAARSADLSRQRYAATRQAPARAARPAPKSVRMNAQANAAARQAAQQRRAAAERELYRRALAEERRRAAAAAEEKRRREYLRAFERQLKAEKREIRKRERAEERARIRATEREYTSREVRVERSRISFPFIATLLISAVMIMAVIFSYAQVSGTSRAISKAKDALTAIEAEKEELTFALEEKNDVRLIEKIATEKIGMVKEGAVTKRFISMSDGDSIELEAGSGEQQRSGALGSVLSAIAGFFDNIRNFVE